MSEEILILDCRGALCPMPIIELSGKIKGMPSGGKILLKADDPATPSDIEAWSRLTGNKVIKLNENEFEVTKS